MKKILYIMAMLVLIAVSGCTSDSDHKHSDDELHDYSVEIEGSEMKSLTVQEVADVWDIDSQELLNRIVEEFNFTGDYTTETVLEDMRSEYKFSPAIIKDIAEEIKAGNDS